MGGGAGRQAGRRAAFANESGLPIQAFGGLGEPLVLRQVAQARHDINGGHRATRTKIHSPLPPTEVCAASGTRLVEQVKVESPNVQYGEDSITSTYTYHNTEVERTEEGQWKVKPQATEYTFKTDTRVPKLGCARRPSRLPTPPTCTASA